VGYYIGIDGGGSKTTCEVGDEKSVLATATAGPSNVVRVGEARARESIHQAVRQACAAAGIAPGQIARGCIGAAGAARPEIVDILRRALGEVLTCPVEVTGDMQTALDAAFGEGPGIVVNAGTGSFAYGRDAQGKTVRAGGWGFAISDEGSAHWIGRAAIAMCFRVRDEGREPALLQGILSAWKLESVDELVRAANGSPAPDFAAVFPLLVSAQGRDVEIAREVLTSAGRELARLANSAIGRLFPRVEAQANAVPVAVAGSVFRHSKLVREVFYNEIRSRDARVTIEETIVEPVEGALWRARRQEAHRA